MMQPPSDKVMRHNLLIAAICEDWSELGIGKGTPRADAFLSTCKSRPELHSCGELVDALGRSE